MSGSFDVWASSQLSRLLPLDDDSLRQVIAYAQSLPKDAASEHLTNLLGDTAPALEFISAFNQRRPNASAAGADGRAPATAQTAPASGSQTHDAVPPRVKKGKSGAAKKNFNALPPPRRVEDYGQTPAYRKRDEEEDYLAATKKGTSRGSKKQLASTLALQEQPEAVQTPQPLRPDPAVDDVSMRSTAPKPAKLPPSASGPLISDTPKGKSRTSSPAPAKTKVNVTGGTAMRGGSAALADLDSAIRQLEQQTNPALAAAATADAELRARRCNCMAQRHALLAAAPNCLACGKVVCAKEGLGPCTFCGRPLLARADLAAMLRSLKDERGRERMAEHNAQHRRAELAAAPRPFSGASSGAASDAEADDDDAQQQQQQQQQQPAGEAAALARARAHRDRLLAFQAQNAQRTAVHDEAADFATPDAGTSQWASATERALQLKRQQRVLREQAWAAAPEYERRRVVVALDVRSGKAVRRFETISKEEALGAAGDEDVEEDGENEGVAVPDGRSGSGFARNPLLGGLVRPVWKPESDKGKGRDVSTGDGERRQRQGDRWRRVQDEDEDNERWILDGGAYGGGGGGGGEAGSNEEPAGG